MFWDILGKDIVSLIYFFRVLSLVEPQFMLGTPRHRCSSRQLAKKMDPTHKFQDRSPCR